MTESVSKPLWRNNVLANRIEKASRLPILIPLLISAVGSALSSSHMCQGIFRKEVLDIAKEGWKVRRGINALRVIPVAFYVVPMLQRSESFHRTHIVETIEDTAAVSAMCLGSILTGTSLTGISLGRARSLFGNIALSLWITETSINLGRRLSGDGSRDALLRSSLNFGFCMSALCEAKASWLEAAVGSFPFCHGLVGQGFGILFSGFGVAAAFARILT